MNKNILAFEPAGYDEKIRSTLPYYDEFYNQIIDVVQIYKPKALNWLDAGCGTGKMAEVAFEKMNIDRFVFCDCSAEMIQIVKSRNKNKNVEFILSDVRDLEYNEAFEVITSVQVNHYLHKEGRLAAIETCYKALKPDGLFFTFENFAPSSTLGEQICLNRWKAYQLKQGKDNEECNRHIGRYKKDYFPVSLWEHLDIMKRCGFKAAEVLWLSYMQAGFMGIK